jgi:hypothetical protein
VLEKGQTRGAERKSTHKKEDKVKSKKTTKVAYCLGDSFGTQYALGNVSGYGTKWEVSLRRNSYGDWEISGKARLLNRNCVIDEEFREEALETNDFFEDIGY